VIALLSRKKVADARSQQRKSMCVNWPPVRRNCFASPIAVLTRTRIDYNTRRLPSPTRIPCIRICQTHEMRVRKSPARTACHMSASPIPPFARTYIKLHSSTHLSTHPSSNYTPSTHTSTINSATPIIYVAFPAHLRLCRDA